MHAQWSNACSGGRGDERAATNLYHAVPHVRSSDLLRAPAWRARRLKARERPLTRIRAVRTRAPRHLCGCHRTHVRACDMAQGPWQWEKNARVLALVRLAHEAAGLAHLARDRLGGVCGACAMIIIVLRARARFGHTTESRMQNSSSRLKLRGCCNCAVHLWCTKSKSP